jgi:hypothetical protein
MPELVKTFTSDGSKLMFHEETMRQLRDGVGRPLVSHIMPTDTCQDSCSFCSVSTRDGKVLAFQDMIDYLDILLRYGLKAVIISGGGNPILYKCPKTGKNFNQLVEAIHERGLEIGLITNGMALRRYQCSNTHSFRESWGTVRPETLDMLTWVRVSMSGLDHERRSVEIPDIDPEKTTLGLSYVFADIFDEPADKHHGKVSTPGDLITLGSSRLSLKPTWWAADRVDELTEQIGFYVQTYKPRYCRLLPNCLEPDRISDRCEVLQGMADAINKQVGYEPCFVQHKPPRAPAACYIGYLHPVLSTDGLVYPCDSVTLAVAEVAYRENRSDHRFASPWAICHWQDIAKIYDEPVRSLIKHPEEMCRGCVFETQNSILKGVVDGTAAITPPAERPVHENFV